MAKPLVRIEMVDAGKYQQRIRELMRHSKYNTVPKMLRHMARMTVELLLKFTPPHGHKPASEDWKEQRARGMASVASDINKVFWKLDRKEPRIVQHNKKAAKAWRKAMQAGDVQRVEKLLQAFKFPSRGVVLEASSALHEAARKRGEVPKEFSPPYHVIRSTSLRLYIKNVQRRVGEWKHGWAAAVTGLGMKKIPQWIMFQKSDPGVFQDNSSNRNDPHIFVSNSANRTGWVVPSRILRAVKYIVEWKVGKELQAILDDELAKSQR